MPNDPAATEICGGGISAIGVGVADGVVVVGDGVSVDWAGGCGVSLTRGAREGGSEVTGVHAINTKSRPSRIRFTSSP